MKNLRDGTGTVGNVGSALTITHRALSDILSQAMGKVPLEGPPLHVALPATSAVEWLSAFLFWVGRGHVVVPIAREASEGEVVHLLEEARVNVWSASKRRCPLPSIETCDPTTDDVDGRIVHTKEHPALILMTSGTTGKPKAARLSHKNLEAQTRALAQAWELQATDRLIHTLPLHHLHGVVVALLATLRQGGSVRALEKFDVQTLLSELPAATVWMSVPSMIAKVLAAMEAAEPEDREVIRSHFRGLRLWTSGSAALLPSVGEQLIREFGSLPLERYGMTEIGIALSNPLDPRRRIVGSVGAPIGDTEIRIVDETGADADEGELLVRGSSVFLGYIGGRDPLDGDGYFRTGDVARRRADGLIVLLGRTSSDILKSGGEKVSALEIESELLELGWFQEVAVIGVPDRLWGDRVVAIGVPKRPRGAGESGNEGKPHPSEEGQTLGQAMRAALRPKLSPWKIPKDLLLVASLPRNAMGKVTKRELAARVVIRDGQAQFVVIQGPHDARAEGP